MSDTRHDDWDDEDRAIARALGASEAGGAAGTVDADAVAEYEAVLAHLPFEEVAPAPHLEDRVIAAALSQRPASARALPDRTAPARVGGRSVRVRGIAIAATLAAAAAIVVVLVIGRPSSGPGAPGARIEPADASGELPRVLAAGGTREAVMRTASGAVAGKVALGADGQGFVYDLTPAPTGARWLWLDTTSGAVRVGRLADARTVHFVVHGDEHAVNGVFVTTESGAGTPAAPGRVTSRASFPSS